jgi:hypothetical protein
MEPASSKGRGKYSDRLLDLIDKCLAPDFDERPRSINECLILLEANQHHRLREIIASISWKTIHHFANWAKPNDGLHSEELIAFVLACPAIDLSWRIGKGIPDKATAKRLRKLLRPTEAHDCLNVLAKKGFPTGRD